MSFDESDNFNLEKIKKRHERTALFTNWIIGRTPPTEQESKQMPNYSGSLADTAQRRWLSRNRLEQLHDLLSNEEATFPDEDFSNYLGPQADGHIRRARINRRTAALRRFLNGSDE